MKEKYFLNRIRGIREIRVGLLFLNHNAKIQHSESAIHGFSRLLTFSHRFSRLFLKISPEG